MDRINVKNKMVHFSYNMTAFARDSFRQVPMGNGEVKVERNGNPDRCPVGAHRRRGLRRGRVAPRAPQTPLTGQSPHRACPLRDINLLQVNLHKGKPATTELNKWKYDVALVQEPNITSGSKLSLIQHPRKYFCKERARAAVILTEDLEYWPIDSLSTRDLAVIALDADEQTGTIILASGYMDINEDAPPAEFNLLVDYCNSKRIPLIMGVDSNAHSVTWGEKDTNPRGERLEEWVVSNNLFIQNVGSTATHTPENGARDTIIDLTITNSRAKEMVKNWKVDDQITFSDHRMIRFSTKDVKQKDHHLTRSYSKANWAEFSRLISLSKVILGAEDSALDLEAVAESIVSNIQEALDQIAPEHRRKDNPRNTWWSKELRIKRTILKNLYVKRHIHQRVIEKYHSLRREYANDIRQAKTNSWRNFCTRAESAREISKIIRILENPPSKQMSLLQANGETLLQQESTRHLLGTHFPDGIIGNPPPAQQTIEDEEDYTGICQYISAHKVQVALDSFGDFKSAGPDGIPPIALKKLDRGHLEAISLLYKRSLATGKVPACWKKMKVVFIPKTGKDNYAVAKAYRPITLSNFLLKGLERIIQWYLLDHVLKEPLYRQHAYTKGRSCDTALSTFVNDVESAINTGQFLLAVSLDCSGAFDNIYYDSARESMRRKSIPDNIIRWYDTLLRGRIVTTEIQGRTETICPARGSPQGGVLSPLIWNLIMDGFLSHYKKKSIRVLGYADDILLYAVGIDPTTLSNLVQDALNHVSAWGKENGLSFNPVKTSMVLFTKRRWHRFQPSLQLEGSKLELQGSFKYLGVDIHRNLIWTQHIKERTNKCKFLLLKCRNLVGIRWGLSPDKLEWIHKMVIRPKLAYGSVVWATNMKMISRRRIRKVQRLSLLSIFRPLRSTPTAGMECMVGWQPLDDYCEEMGTHTFLRIRDTLVHPNLAPNGHLKWWKNIAYRCIDKEYPVLGQTFKRIWKEPHQEKERKHLPLHIYTDAAKKDINVGLGWCACIGDYIVAEEAIPMKDISVHMAEILAIKAALTWLEENQIDKWNITIHCDSKSAVTVLNGHIAQDDIVLETMQILRKRGEISSVNLEWLKGHSGITGNEYADLLAHSGAEVAKGLQFASPFIPISYKQIVREVRQCYKDKWQKAWDEKEDCRVSRLFYPEIRTSSSIITLDMHGLQQLAKICTGHGLFKDHLRHWNELSEHLCELCGEDYEDTWHIWENCPALKNERKKALLYMKSGLSYERTLLKFFQEPKILEIIGRNEAIMVL